MYYYGWLILLKKIITTVSFLYRSYPMDHAEINFDFAKRMIAWPYLMSLIQFYDNTFEDAEGLEFTKQDMEDGLFIYPLMLKCGSSKPGSGSVRLRIDWAQSIVNPISVICFAEFQRRIVVDKLGQIDID